MLKSVRAAALIAAAVCASNAHAQSRPIRFGTEGAFPPFNFVTPQGEVQGFEIDLAKAICDDLKAKCAFTAQDFDGLIPALEAKKFDVIIAAMNVTAKRKAHVDFTSVYVDVSGRFVGRKGSALVLSNEGLSKTSIGLVSGTVHESYFQDVWKGVNVQVYKSLDNALLDLQSGRVDFVFDDEIGISEGFLKRPEGADYGFVGPAVTDKKYYGGMAMAVRKGDDTLRNDLNKGLTDVIAAGTFKELSIKYFGFDVSKSQ